MLDKKSGRSKVLPDKTDFFTFSAGQLSDVSAISRLATEEVGQLSREYLDQ